MAITIKDIRQAIDAGSTSATEQVQEALKKLKVKNPEFNLTISLLEDRALERAATIDESLNKGEPAGRLAGVPFIAKDNFLTFGGETTAASNILKGFEAPYQATAIERLEAEGAICIGKANLDAFAHGSSTENSDFGPTRNPHDTMRVPGGSSGGSAAAVALGVVPFALGTDTGGSIRQPASFCGVLGLKPTYGTVSRYGVVAMASSTDVIGPLTHTAEDAALVMEVIAGKDERDATTLPEKPVRFIDSETAPLKIGLVKEYMTEDVDSGVRTAIENTAERLRKLGHHIEEISLKTLPSALAVYYIVVPAEISSNLARYDGIRYGFSHPDAHSLSEVYGLTRDEGFNAENKRRILIGTYVLSSGYYDAYYRKAQTVRTLVSQDFHAAFQSYDVLLGPVAPTPAFRLGENADDPLKMYLADIMTVAANLAGIPALSVPTETVDGLPVGAQLFGAQGQDGLLLSLARQLEEARRGE